MHELFTNIMRFSPGNMLLTIGLMLFRSVSSGISFLLILALLQVIGFAPGSNQVHGFAKIITNTFQYIHLPPTLLNILIIYVVIVSFIAVAAFVEQIISTKLQQHYIHSLRTHLYKQLLFTKWPFFLEQKIPNLLHILTTQIQMISNSNFQLLMLLNSIIMLFVYTLLSLLLSWKMTVVAMTCAFLLLSMMFPLHRLTSQSGHYHLKQNQTVFQAITEQLSSLKMIKGSGFEEKFANDTKNISLSLENQNEHLTFVTAATKLLYSIGSVLIFSVLLYIAIKVLAVPLESLLLLIIVFARVLPIISNIQQNYQRILHQLPSFCEVKELLQQCSLNQEHLESAVPLFTEEISLDNLSFSYNPTQAILSNLSLTIKKNTTTAIIGPSGSGKSTLADLIAGLLEPTSGTISIDSRVLDVKNKLSWRHSVAYVTQDVFLFNASIRDNLQLFCPALPDESLWEALKSSAADMFVADLKDGLDTIVGDRGIRLSGGECQRIALARALLSKPQLLILDESTSSLDTDNIIKIQQALTQLRGKITILIISHQTEMRHFADQNIVLLPRQAAVSTY